jgi:hypothetical protein
MWRHGTGQRLQPVSLRDLKVGRLDRAAESSQDLHSRI